MHISHQLHMRASVTACTMYKQPHLAVHAVGHAPVARDGVAKVLDLEAALETRGKKAAERRDDARKHGQHHRVHLRARAQRPSSAVKTITAPDALFAEVLFLRPGATNDMVAHPQLSVDIAESLAMSACSASRIVFARCAQLR